MKRFKFSVNYYISHSETYLFPTAYLYNNVDYMNYLTKIETKIIVFAFLTFRLNIVYFTKIIDLNDLF